MTDAKTSRKAIGRWQLLGIFAVVFVPIAAAYLTYFTGWGVPDDTVNKGTLIEQPLQVGDLLTDSGNSGAIDLTDGKWRLLLPVRQPCAEDCEKNLYTTRQVHIRLGGDGTRVERIAVNLAGGEGRAYLETLSKSHPRLEWITVTPAQWQTWIGGAQSVPEEPYYMLVDQQGYAMMVYTVGDKGNDLLKDIKRVLRYSPE